ncbi:MAG: adenylosuccinate lyase [Candidatus Chisholmbacteria bacterium]|nr:adenylosuccinate lyase [Candidatus Chisholmbacteria bacterium]
MAVSPLDDRYAESLQELEAVFSERRLVKNRVEVEVRYLLALLSVRGLSIEKVSLAQQRKLLGIVEKFNERDFARVKEIEKTTDHDVKAVEYFLQARLRRLRLEGLIPWIHFGLTSEDTNNLAQALQYREGCRVILQAGKSLQEALATIIADNAGAMMLGRTHGQPAVPTTLGKELLVHTLGIQESLENIRDHEHRGKLTGSVGTLAAHTLAFPKVNWLDFAEKFVRSLDLEPEMVTTQVLPPLSVMRLFATLEQLSLLLAALAKDLWWYVAFGYLAQAKIKGFVGSSTMPQKVNPRMFENAEGNAELSAALFSFLSRQLSYSRLQRDLSGSTVKRNVGVAFGHLYLATMSMSKGLGRVAADPGRMREELEAHPEVIAEGVQTLLRAVGDEKAYEKVKEVFQADNFSLEKLRDWVKREKISAHAKERLASLDAAAYGGVAEKLTKMKLTQLKKRINRLA